MSEEAKKAEESSKKKGGKLPVILALVVMLAAGGFFGLKMKGGGEKKKEEIKLGTAAESMVPVKEFLVNMADGTTYLRTEITLHFKEGFKTEEFEKARPAVEDAIRARLSFTEVRATRSKQGMDNLARAIAEDVNTVLERLAPPKKEESPEEDEASEGEKKEGSDEATAESKKDETQPAHPEWHSQKGPVLMVYFTSFATQ